MNYFSVSFLGSFCQLLLFLLWFLLRMSLTLLSLFCLYFATFTVCWPTFTMKRPWAGSVMLRSWLAERSAKSWRPPVVNTVTASAAGFTMRRMPFSTHARAPLSAMGLLKPVVSGVKSAPSLPVARSMASGSSYVPLTKWSKFSVSMGVTL